MKFWEALKAVEEGKTVQFKGAVSWIVWDQRKNGTLEMYEGYEWRLQPEPRELAEVIRADGTVSGLVTTVENARNNAEFYNKHSSAAFSGRPYTVRIYREVMEN